MRAMRKRALTAMLAAMLSIGASVACSNKDADPAGRESAQAAAKSAPALAPVTLSIIGTNDVHGAIDRLPILAGFVDNLRAARDKAGGAVLLIDAGDMFQGSLESNMNEGAAVIDGFNAIGYTAAVIGNHEFDFGPVGEAATPQSPEDDPRGALKARLAQARFPILAGNYLDAATGQPVDWPNAPASVLRELAGVKVGIIGVSTFETPQTTMAANVEGLRMAPLIDTIAREAESLRRQGAQVVIVTAHAGGDCKTFGKPDDLSSCKRDQEIMEVAAGLPAGAVDVIVAGHTHRAMAHRVNGIAIIESYAKLRAFGRVDVRVTPSSAGPSAAKVEIAAIHPPRDLCPGEHRVPADQCQPGEYEGAPVMPSPAVAQAIAPALQAAAERKQASLAVALEAPVTRAYARESALGNLFADLMREARATDAAVTNGGGLRADLPAGLLTYGALYEAMPFDNRFATVTMKAADFARMIAANLGHDAGILSVSGVRASARCQAGALVVELRDARGAVIPAERELRVATSDFLATGGDRGPFSSVPPDAITIHDEAIREGMARILSARGGTLSGTDPTLFDPDQPRLVYQGKRPLRCPPE